MYAITMSHMTLIASVTLWGLIVITDSKLNIRENKIPKFSALHQKALEVFKATRKDSLKVVRILSEDSVASEFPLAALISMTLNQPVSIVLTPKVTDRVDLSFVQMKFRHNHVVDTVSSLIPLIKDNEKVVVLVKVSSENKETTIESWLNTTFSILWAAFICDVAAIVEIEASSPLTEYKSDVNFNYFWKVQENSNGLTEVSCEDCIFKKTKKHYSTVLVYIYQPYIKKTLRKVPTRKLKNLFDIKVKDMAGHDLRIGGHVLNQHLYNNGKEDDSDSKCQPSLIDILGHKLNATIKLMYTQNRDTITRNGTLSAMYRHLMNGDLDLTVTATFIYPELSGVFSMTYPRKRFDLLFVLPKYLYEEVTYKNVLGGKVKRLLLIMAITLITTLTTILVTKRILRLKIEVDFLTNLIKTIFNQSAKLSYTAKSSTLRVALGSWILYTTMFSVTLQTLIISRIIKPYGQKSIDTLEDLRESDIRIVMRDDHLEYVMTHAEEEVRDIVSKKSLKTSNRTIFATPDSHLGYMLPNELAHYATSMSFYEIRNRPFFKIHRETMLPNFEAYYLRKGSPFLQEFDKILSSLAESGVLNYWNENKNYRMLFKIIIPKDVRDIGTNYVNLKNLKSVFYFFIVGLSIALIVFFYEVALGTYF